MVNRILICKSLQLLFGQEIKAKVNEEFVKDIVYGMVKPKSQMKFTSEFLGKTCYLDTEKDKELFDAHPDYWISKEESEKFRKATVR